MTFADELAQVLDDGDNLRVMPIVTYGAASNLDDLLYLRGVDVVMTQSDVFEYFRTQRKTPNLERRIHYIIRLPVSELHVLARTETKSIEDLRGKKVSFGPAGAASSLTGTIVFQRLGVQVEQVLMDNPTALEKLKSGEIAALVRVIGSRSSSSRGFPRIRVFIWCRFPFLKPLPTTTRSASSPVRNIRHWFRRGKRPTLSRCRRCSRFSTGRKIPIATGVCKGLPRPFSPSGISLANPTAIQNGATSILRRPFPVGPAGASLRRC